MRRLDAADRLLRRRRQVEPDAPAEVLAELEPAAGPGGGVPVGVRDLVEDPLAVQRHHALDAARGDVVERLAAGDRLPDLDRAVDRPRHERDLAELVAAVRHGGRDVVVLAVVAEGLLVQRLPEDLHLLLEQLAVGGRVQERRAEGLDLARVVAAAHAHDDPAAGDDVGDGVVLGQPEGMPHGEDVEGAAELEPLGLGGEPRGQEDQVREDLVALPLEVVLRGPQAVEAELVHGPGDVPGREERLREPLVRVAPQVRGGAVAADPVELDLPDVEHRELRDHPASPRPPRGLSRGTPPRPRPRRPAPRRAACGPPGGAGPRIP